MGSNVTDGSERANDAAQCAKKHKLVGPDLASFSVTKVLQDDARSKRLLLLGKFAHSEEQAIIVVSRQHFEATAGEAIVRSSTAIHELHHNDIYYKYEVGLQEAHSRVVVDVIYPCTERHIAKYAAQEGRIVEESPALYENVVLPHIRATDPGRVQWVYNILEGRSEQDRVVHHDEDPGTGFVIVPDSKWDRKQVEELYCVALVQDRGLRTLRDLRSTHLPLLRNILGSGGKAIADRWSVPQACLRAYLHYYPSYFHLHVHFVHVKLDMGFGMSAGKGHLLQDVISLLTVCPDYFAKATLGLQVGTRDPLYALISAASSADAASAQGALAPE